MAESILKYTRNYYRLLFHHAEAWCYSDHSEQNYSGVSFRITPQFIVVAKAKRLSDHSMLQHTSQTNTTRKRS